MSARIVVDVDDRGNVTATCSCGDFAREVTGPGAARLVRSGVAAHVGLHATAEAHGIPWETVQGLVGLQAWAESDGRS